MKGAVENVIFLIYFMKYSAQTGWNSLKQFLIFRISKRGPAKFFYYLTITTHNITQKKFQKYV